MCNKTVLNQSGREFIISFPIALKLGQSDMKPETTSKIIVNQFICQALSDTVCTKGIIKDITTSYSLFDRASLF